jgi:hypothetical protein
MIPARSRSQTRTPREKYWTFGYNIGFLGFSPSNLDYANSSMHFQRTMGSLFSMDGRKNLTVSASSSLGLHTGFLWKDKRGENLTAIEGEIQVNKANYAFSDPSKKIPTPNDHDADDIGRNDSIPAPWIERDRYLKYSISLQRFWHREDISMLGGEKYIYLKESFGQTFFHRNQGQPIALNRVEDLRDPNGYGVVSKTVAFNPCNWMVGTEIGVSSFSKSKDRSLNVGLVYYAPSSSTFTQQYEFFKKNVSTGKSDVTFNGGSLLLNVSYSFNSRFNAKSLDTTKESIEDEFVHTHRLNGRKCDIQKTVTLSSDQVSILVWDKGIVDGDRISLYLNGEIILSDFTVSKKKKELTLHLNPGSNYLVLHALNLGKIPPNTAAIQIEDGGRKKNITLNSNMRRSGVLEIIYTP